MLWLNAVRFIVFAIFGVPCLRVRLSYGECFKSTVLNLFYIKTHVQADNYVL